jgi:hypothetical protein
MLIQEMHELETAIGLVCTLFSVAVILVVGMTADLVKLVRNPYFRKHLCWSVIKKSIYSVTYTEGVVYE